ncbi:UNVERIFIED_CONTAM: Monoacylglycerol lipase abhd2 [Gekko kuhli]
METPELPAVFDGVKLAAVAAVLYIIVRCLNLKSPTAPPELLYQDTPLSRFLLKSCPLLTKESLDMGSTAILLKLSRCHVWSMSL